MVLRVSANQKCVLDNMCRGPSELTAVADCHGNSCVLLSVVVFCDALEEGGAQPHCGNHQCLQSTVNQSTVNRSATFATTVNILIWHLGGGGGGGGGMKEWEGEEGVG